MLNTWQLKPVGSTENTIKKVAVRTKVAFEGCIIVSISMVTTNCLCKHPCSHVE